jgi:predicted transcriptional regulator
MPRDEGELQDRDQQILNRLAKIQRKVDSIEQTTAFALRADKSRQEGSLKEIFKNGKRLAQVYLAADGTRSVQEVADHLGMKRPNVSRPLSQLHVEGLLEILDTIGGKDYWGKTPIDRTIRITPLLCDMFNLSRDGTQRKTGPVAKNKKRK